MSKIPAVLPEGTTHFCPAFGRYPTRAMKHLGGDEWAYWTGFDWHLTRVSPLPSVRREMIDVRPKCAGPSIAELIEQGWLAPLPFKCTAKPVTWNGPEDGLPPVGLEVDYEPKAGDADVWRKGQVVAPLRGGVVIADSNGDHVELCYENYRPIRTAEQLAAEAHRAKYMPQLIKLWDADTKRTEFLEAVYALIVEAGKS